MPRRKLIRTNEFPYHVVNRSNNKAWFALPMPKVWDLTLESLQYANNKFPIKLHAFVLMENHYHMLLSTPDSNIDQFMQAFNHQFSGHLRYHSNHINRMFGGRYKWSIINNKNYLSNVYRYIFQNPVKASLVKTCEQYPFSTLAVEMTGSKFVLPIENLLELPHTDLLDWFNEPASLSNRDDIRKGLRYGYFRKVP